MNYTRNARLVWHTYSGHARHFSNYRICKFVRAEFSAEVAGRLPAFLYQLEDGFLYSIRRLRLDCVAQQHDRRQDERRRIRVVQARVLRRTAVHRLKYRAVLAYICARRKAQAAYQSGAQVGYDVAVQVRQYHHVEGLRLLHQLHAGRVHDLVLELYLRVLRYDAARYFQKQAIRAFHDVRLMHCRDLFPPVLHSVVKCVPYYPLRAFARDELDALRRVTPAVLTFDTHPDTLVKGVEVPLINSPEGRAEIIRRVFGIDSVIFIHFNRAVMQMPWQDFMGSLVNELHAVHVVVGYDFSCGYRGEGKALKIAGWCSEHGIGCDIMDAVKLDGDVVSSTRIRKLIADGDMEEANRLLGHPHCLVDTVHYGFQLGGKLGTPTINMRFAEGVLVPRHGVYAAKVFLDNGAEHMAVTNVGVRPTVSGSDRVSVESYILDFEGDLYDHTVRVEFHHFIRDERKFSGVDELKAQILRDAETTREYFAKA